MVLRAPGWSDQHVSHLNVNTGRDPAHRIRFAKAGQAPSVRMDWRAEAKRISSRHRPASEAALYPSDPAVARIGNRPREESGTTPTGKFLDALAGLHRIEAGR